MLLPKELTCAEEKIAIVGVAFRFPGDIGDEPLLWDALQNGRDLVTEVGPDRWATSELQHPRRGEAGRSVTFSAGVLSRIDEFDAGFFGISPREAAWLDPQQRLLLELAWEATENGGMPAAKLAGSDCAVYVGISGLDYGIRGLDDLASFSAHTMTGNTLSIAANRLSYVFDLRGPSMAIDTACSSSLVALHQACNCLRSGDASMAMVGGVNMLTHPYPFIGFSKASMLSARGRCHTFDASGDGYVRAEGGAVLLLKPLSKAQADGDRIHAVILASGANADGGRKTGLTIPSGEGQIELMRTVLARAGIEADDLDYLEAHGTGTSIGDPIETSAIGAVYGAARSAARPLPIGSVKTNLGHLEPASGMAGLVKALLVLKHREVPPSIHLDTRNPKIDFEGWHLHPVTTPLRLETPNDRPSIVGVNSFGFGGANAHVILQEYPSLEVADAHLVPEHLPPLILTAKSEAALRELAAGYGNQVALASKSGYYDIAYSAAYRRDRLEKRLLVNGDRIQDIAAALGAYSSGGVPQGLVTEDAPRESGKLAFVYAGNGAQWVGMGQQLLTESERFADIVSDLDRRIVAKAGISVIAELRAGAALSRMSDTAVGQPLLFSLQVALTLMLREQGLIPDVVTGHSVGEVAAAWAAGALTLDEAVHVICARSAAQALTRGAGRMAAISMPEADMREWLASGQWPDLEIAGINSSVNLTLSGPLVQLESLALAAKARGVTFRLLDLDYAFHSRRMDPVESTLTQSLTGFSPDHARHVPFVSTVTGGILDASLDATYWWKNIRQPVRFKEAVEAMIGLGCRTFVEISPHAILQRYLKECALDQEVKAQVLSSLRKNNDGPDRIQSLTLRLHLLASGDTLQHRFPVIGRHVDLPSYPWQRERHWLPNTVEGYRLIERKRVHPLLGWPLKDAQAGWENILDARNQLWLADHCVGGAVVLPGAAFVEMALAAARETFGGFTQEIEEIDIVAPVVFDGEHGRSIRFDLNPRDGGFQIRSRERLSHDEWTLNASGRLLGAVSGYTEQDFALDEVGVVALDGDTHYHLAHLLGLDYGPVFQGMRRAVVGKDRLSGEILPPLDLTADGEPWLLHPAILDVCFQSLLDFFRAEIEAGVGVPLLPVKVGRLRLLRQATVVAFRTRIRRRSLRSVLADFELLTVDGEKVAVLDGCRFRAASLRQGRAADPACWQIVPVLQPGINASASTILPEIHKLSQGIKDWFVDQENRLHRDVYFGEVQPLFDALVTAFAYEAMQALMTDQADEVQTWLDSEAHDDERQQMRLWVRNLLVDQSALSRNGDGWSLSDIDIPSAAEIWRTLLAEYPESMTELVLLGRRGSTLPDLLAGRLDPVSLAADLRTSHQLDTMYDDSLSYVGSRHAVERLIDAALAAHSPSGRMRILEISAGLSEIPRQLGHRLATSAIDYVLAHADPDACDHLRHEYGEDAWVSVVDLETSPPGFKSQRSLPTVFDVVIFRHTLNGVSDPRGLLAWGQNRLAAGGIMVIAERYPDLASDLAFGPHCLVLPRAWEAELKALAFEDVETCREPAGESSAAGGYLVVGKRSDELVDRIPSELGRWLLLAGDDKALGLVDALREVMVAQGQLAVGVASAGHLLDREQATALLSLQQRELDGEIDHVLLIAGQRGEDDVDLSVEGLNLVQALSTWPQPPRLTFVTTGAVPVEDFHSSAKRNPAHTALWGLGRVVMNEYPGLSCRLIDLPQSTPAEMSAEISAELLGDELLNPDGESEIILQPSGRHVLRMQRTELARDTDALRKPSRYRLDFRVPGQLRNLLWLEQPAIDLGPEDVEVRPLATGLNFRDIMYVMGLLPDEAVEHGFAGASLGLEFSGVVTRVGAKVEEYAAGDAVMGFGSACFSSHVVTRANALTPKPATWSFEAAATVPTVFFTVYYALKQLANLQPGERVLIHGAAGGVGIAAVQLARHLGAEIFATAGTAEKRQFVDLLGADHVFDSRSLAYADQILAATNGEGVDVVLNSLAGEAIRRNLRVLRPFGRFLELGKRDFFENTPIGLRPFKDNISYFGIDADQLLIARPDLAGRLFREVMALFRNGVLSPLPVRAFAAERVIDAFRYMQQARQIGKVVVTFDGARIHAQSSLPKQASTKFSADGAYLVTGGISGFGLETARWLAREGAGQLVLLGRRGMSTPVAAEAKASIEALGAKVLLLACDVADRVALQAVLTQTGLKPIKGIFHAAMVIDDALISALDPERMRRVLIPKIKGAWNLHQLTLDIPLDHFMLYSSVTTYIGNPGQANYVAGNAWLEGLAGLRRAAGLPVTCIGWGPIGDAGYLARNTSVKDSLASRLGAEPLSSKAAMRMLGRALMAPQANVSIGDFQFSVLSRLLPSAQGPRFAALRRHSDDTSAGAETLDDFRVLIEGKSAAEVQAIVTQLVTHEVAEILAVSPERIDPARSLHDLGLDSLMGIELALGLEKRFGIPVPAMMLNEGPTVERVTARIVERIFADNAGAEANDALREAAVNVAAQHGEAMSREVLDAVVAEIEKEQA